MPGLLDTAMKRAKWQNAGTVSRQARGLLDTFSEGGLAGLLGMPAWYEQSPQDIAMGFAGSVTPKVGAALPLDTASRLARAAQQGFTVDAYKGAPARVGGPTRNWKGEVIADHDAPYVDLNHFKNPDRPYAGFFSDDPGVASRFANAFGGGAVSPVKLKFSSPLVIDAQGKPAAAFQFESVAREHKATADYQRFAKAFDDPAIDGVIIKNTKDEGTVYVPRAPQQVRSRFAAFDPAKAASPDLMAGVAGLGILGAAGAEP